MQCYQCGARFAFNQGDVCPNCQAPLKEYKEAIERSMALYDAGLKKAKERDLSGAILDLGISLRIYKKNTYARNLLGLIYYEICEYGEAKECWQHSVHYQKDDNPAHRYLSIFQDIEEKKRMEEAIHSYNFSLENVKTGNLDIAKVQLKKLVSEHKNYIKAVQLYALLLMKEEDYQKAGRIIKSALKTDKMNKLLLDYQEELNNKSSAAPPARKKSRTKKKKERTEETGTETVRTIVWSEASLLQSFLYILCGIVLGAAAVWFLIVPSIQQRMANQNNQLITSYGDQLSAKDVEVMNLQDQIEDINKERDEAVSELKAYTGKDGVLEAYDQLLECLQSYVKDDYLEAVQAFNSIKKKASGDDTYKAVYDQLAEEFTTNGVTTLYDEATRLYNRRNYAEAVKYYKECLKLNPDYPRCIYWLALSCWNSGDTSSAHDYFQKLVDEYPSDYYGRRAAIYVNQVR